MIAAGCASGTSMSVPIEPTPGACRVEEARTDYRFPIVPVSVKVTTAPSARIEAAEDTPFAQRRIPRRHLVLIHRRSHQMPACKR